VTGTIYSKCGFHCDKCPAFKNNSATEEKRIQGSRTWEKYFGLHLNPELIRCEGCQCERPWNKGNLLPDRTCIIRSCAEFNAVSNCAHCSNFPCREYLQKVPGAELRKQREAAAKINLSDDEYRRYIEPFEGQTHLKELRANLRSEDIKQPSTFSSKNKIVPFPDQLSPVVAEQVELRSLHEALKAVYSIRAATYAGQVLMERRKPYLRGILWVMAFYGRLEEGKLIVESTVWGNDKQCSRLVRKGDNSLHTAVREAAQILLEHGFFLDFQSSGRDWVLILSLEPSKLNNQMLSALKTYATALVGEYGKPVYVDSYNLRGKAFKLFSALDMTLFQTGLSGVARSAEQK
jgi:hypothetical protein